MQPPIQRIAIATLAALCLLRSHAQVAQPADLRPIVEVEEEVYRFVPADNGAGPMWCSGSTCLVRDGDRIFATGLETIPTAKPLNNVRWLLFERDTLQWHLLLADPSGRTREPSPIGIFPRTHLLLSCNPTRNADPNAYAGPAEPQILQFLISDLRAPFQRWLPPWNGTPPFTEHSYRSLAVDGPNRELILFQNIDYSHAEWAFRDRDGRWPATGKLRWPADSGRERSEPIRVCYPNVALKDRAVYFCGVSDIIEPNPAWRAFKKELTGREWDYDFRRLFFTWSPDVTREGFRPWVEIASRETTCGWISPGDLWIAPDNTIRLVWSERAIDERLRPRFFPNARQIHQLNYAVVQDGKVTLQRTLLEAREGESREIPSAPRFHVTPDNRLFVVCYVGGTAPSGKAVSENRLFELRDSGGIGPIHTLPLQDPFHSLFTATPRAGSLPTDYLDILGHQIHQPNTISYARIRFEPVP
jgi:hypothetical protein